MWPFSKKKSSGSLPDIERLPFKSGEAFLEYQCRFGHTKLQEGISVVALVLDAKKKYGVSVSVKIEADGRQLATLKVASDDGGFVVPAYTPSGTGDSLKPGDVVMWVPAVFSEELAKGMGDMRSGWVGFIRAKIAPEIGVRNPGWKILCEYN